MNMRLMATLPSSLVLAGCAASAPLPVAIGAPPAALALDPFYVRSIDARGITVSSSAKVSDTALRAARSIVREMLASRPDLASALVRRGQRVVVMAQAEGTTDLPEQRDWKKPTRDDPRLTVCERKLYDERIGRLTDAQYWNARARGMGGVLTSGAEENILGVPGTRYYGENILVHEFSHAILDAVEEADPRLYRDIAHAYDRAQDRGLWKSEYGATSIQEYWAEGTQFWFESNKVAVVDSITVLSAADLRRRDPRLYRLLGRIYGNRHRLTGDIFWRHPARVPPGGPPRSTAEQC